jgi:hypothetical protein
MAMSKTKANWAQKDVAFQGLTLPMALVLDVARIKIIPSMPYKQQVH